MRKTKSVLSVVLALAMLLSMFAIPAAAQTAAVEESTATAETETSSEDSGDASTFSWDNATVYFLLTDRFNNGDTSNDNSYDRGLDENGDVVTNMDTRATFHGGDFVGITEKIEEGYFDDLGVNALWISAPYEQIHGYVVGSDDNPSYPHYSYHGYYVLDYTEADANFGTKEEFQELVDTAHEHGIRIVIDIVMNHAGYNSIYDMNEYGFGTLLDGWESVYYDFTNISNSSYHSYIDYTSSSSDWLKWWGSSWIRCGLPGYTEGGGDNYTSSLSGLPDFMTESTTSVGIPTLLETKWTEEGTLSEKYATYGTESRRVTQWIADWLAEWVREYGIDGFRCDTAKHVEYASWKILKDTCTEALKEWKEENPEKALDDLDFWMTGESWDHGVGYDSYYSEGGFDSMINFETNGGGILSSDTLASTYESYASSINSRDDFNVLSFISSHDEDLANRNNLIYLGSAFLLLPGAVQIYYGDETARGYVEGIDVDGGGGSGHALRSDMNWSSMDEDVLAHWQIVGTFRNNHIAVGAGDHETVTASSGVGFIRTYSKNGISDTVAAVVGASANTDVTIDVSSAWEDGTVLMNAYDESTATVSGGTVTFNSGANSTILIEADDTPEGSPTVTVTGSSSFEDTQTVTISIENADYATVSIDGAKKFIAYDGDTFTIGETAYPGDTVKVVAEVTNDVSTVTRTFSFTKIDTSSDDDDDTSESVTIYVKPYSTVPNLYVWETSSGTNNELTSSWPGDIPTNKTDDGWYYITFDGYSSVNLVINFSGGSQSADITGLTGEVYFEMTDDSGSSYTKTQGTTATSDMDALKALCRTIKNLTASDYTSAAYDPLIELVAEADVLIAQGSSADEDEVSAMYDEVLSGYNSLVLATPVVTSMTVGSTTISGTAAYGSTVIVTVNGASYTTTADEITGEWSVTLSSSITSSTTAIVSATNDVADSASATVTPDTVGSTDVDTSTDTSVDTDTATDTDTTVDTDTATDTDTTVDTDAAADTDSSVDTDTAADTDSSVDTDTAADTDSTVDTDTAADTDSTVDTDTSTSTDSDTDTDTSTVSNLTMDVNGDGKVTLKDASLVQRYIAQLTTLTSNQQTKADANGSGKIDTVDVMYILMYIAYSAS